MDKGAWCTTIHRVTKSWTQLKRLGTHAYSHRPPQALTSQQCIYIFPGHNYSFSHFTSKISCKLFQTLCGTREYKYYTPRKKMFRLKSQNIFSSTHWDVCSWIFLILLWNSDDYAEILNLRINTCLFEKIPVYWVIIVEYKFSLLWFLRTKCK